MNLDRVFNIASMIVLVALVTTIVSRRNSANVIRAMGRTFSDAIRASMGR